MKSMRPTLFALSGGIAVCIPPNPPTDIVSAALGMIPSPDVIETPQRSIFRLSQMAGMLISTAVWVAMPAALYNGRCGQDRLSLAACITVNDALSIIEETLGDRFLRGVVCGITPYLSFSTSAALADLENAPKTASAPSDGSAVAQNAAASPCKPPQAVSGTKSKPKKGV